MGWFQSLFLKTFSELRNLSNKFETNISLMIAAEGITRISSAYNIPIDQLTAGYDDLVKLGMLFYYYKEVLQFLVLLSV